VPTYDLMWARLALAVCDTAASLASIRKNGQCKPLRTHGLRSAQRGLTIDELIVDAQSMVQFPEIVDGLHGGQQKVGIDVTADGFER
jgi:hypothetical protein